MAECINILIDQITVDDELQVRDFTRASKIDEYTQRIKDGAHFPPIHCGRLKGGDGTIYLIDGFHRLQAYVNADVERVDVEIEEYEERRLMFAYAFRVNNSHGINMTDPEEESGLDKIIQLFPEKSIRQLVDLTGCTRWKVSQRINQLSGTGQLERPEKIIGTDGKEYRATKPPAQPAERKGKDSGMANATPEKPDTPCHFCAGGCGTPIWEEMKNAPDSTYFHIQKNGMTLWFCSEECYRHSWHCPPDEKECEDVEEDDAPVYVKCEHCGKTTTLQEAKDYRKSGWQPTDCDFNRWYCSEECMNAAAGVEAEPAPKREPPAREPAPSSCQASGEEPEQEEEPDEFAFNDVDAETLPVQTPEQPEANKCRLRVIYDVESEIADPAELMEQLKLRSPFTFFNANIPSIKITLAGLYENINQSLNNNININPATFTEFFICCKGKKGPVKVFISRKKYDEWKTNFGPSFDIDANLDECCKYYNELTGSDMLSASGVYAKVYAWLLKNWKAQQKQSKPKQNAYKDAGLRFDPSDY